MVFTQDKLLISWVLLVFSLLLHVFDEALNNFLEIYNTMV